MVLGTKISSMVTSLDLIVWSSCFRMEIPESRELGRKRSDFY